MKETLRKAILIGAGLLLMTFAGAGTAFAQASEGLNIKPAIVEDNVKPGDSYRFSLAITNIGADDRTFYLSTQDIQGLDDNGLPIFAPQGVATGYELSSWVELPSASITLKAGESTTVALTAHVPNGASPGAHFGAVFLSDKANQPGANGSGVGFNVGSIISLTIAGNITNDAKLREFSTGKVVYGVANVDFNTKIENLGNVLVRPHGVISITDMFGRNVANVEVNDSAAPVFPGSERIYATTWNSDSFAVGRYEAVGSFSYGDTEKKTISGSTSFWVLPLKPIAIFLGIIIGIVLALYVAVKLYIRRKLRDMGMTSASRTDMNFYARKYQRSGSRLIVITLAVFLVSVAFLAVLFFMFA